MKYIRTYVEGMNREELTRAQVLAAMSYSWDSPNLVLAELEEQARRGRQSEFRISPFSVITIEGASDEE